MRPVDVLVVDDDPIVRSFLSDVMKDEGYSTRSADNGRAALEECDHHRPDLMLLDLRMPLLDGMSTILEIERQGWEWFPIVIVTGDFNTPRDLPTRVVAVLRKPVDLDELCRTTRSALSLVPEERRQAAD